MPRIRTIKPEFFRSPDTAKVSPRARLLYIAMWSWADDYGVGETNLNGLLGFAFPDEDQVERKEIQSLLKEVADGYGTAFFTHRGRYFYQVTSWDKHQKTERRAAQRNPAHDDPESAPDQRFCAQGFSEATQGSTEPEQGETPLGTGEQGNREQGKRNASASATTPARFDEFWAAYPERKNKQPAIKAWRNAVRVADPDVIIEGARRYARWFAEQQSKDATSKAKYPDGWLNAGRWEDELGTPGQDPAQRGSFTAPPLPEGAPRALYVPWNRAHRDAWLAGKNGPTDWRTLQVAS